MSNDLLSFPAPKGSHPTPSGPAMYMRYEFGGAVRRIELPEYKGPALAETSLIRAQRIAREVAQQVALNPRLRRVDTTVAPRSLDPRRYGAGLFLVPEFPYGLKHKRRRLQPRRMPQQPSLLRSIAKVFARSLRSAFSLWTSAGTSRKAIDSMPAPSR